MAIKEEQIWHSMSDFGIHERLILKRIETAFVLVEVDSAKGVEKPRKWLPRAAFADAALPRLYRVDS